MEVQSREDPRPQALFQRWERQQWSADAIDFTHDRDHWLSLSDKERWQWYWLAGFAHFRQTEFEVMISLARLLPALPYTDQQTFLSSQIADEGRHDYFFNRFHNEVLAAAQPTGNVKPSALYQRFVAEIPIAAAAKAAADPTPANLARAALHIFVVLEGSLALASFSIVRKLLARVNLFPGLMLGMTHAQRDEVRHAQFGVSLLRSIFRDHPSARAPAAEYMRELLPMLDGISAPQTERTAVLTSLGIDPMMRRRKIFALLRRHLAAIDLEVDVEEHVALAA